MDRSGAQRHGATVARLSIEPSNAPSIAVARRLGLEPVGDEWDEDDQVWERVFEGPLPIQDRR